jgi:hypothetical protein
VRAVSALSHQLRMARELRVRVSVHTGSVVVSEMGTPERRELLAVGDTPNLAARLQTLAEPGTVVVSEATYLLTQSFFRYRALGSSALKGFDKPVEVFEALAHTGNPPRLSAASRLRPLVGREQDLAFLQERWREATRGQGSVVTLGGEPGIGKSRIVRALRDAVADDPHRLLECYCSPLFSNTALHPWIEMLERRLAFTPKTTQRAKLRRLERALRWMRIELSSALPLLASLLSIELPDSYAHRSALMGKRDRQALFDCLLSCLAAISRVQPVLLVVEDVHWADPSSLELLKLLIAQEPRQSVLLVLTHRPELSLPWASARLSQRVIQRMPQADAARVVAGIAKGRALTQDVLQKVLERADGVPLYLEEITKAVLETAAASSPHRTRESQRPLAIPPTLQASLSSRLDGLGSGKQVLQVASVMGRSFDVSLLGAALALDASALRTEVDRLIDAEMLLPSGERPEADFVFKHTLIQDAAYASLLRGTRQQYHRQVAQVLVAHAPDLVSAKPELLARHYTEAGMLPEAVQYWGLAAERALKRSAHSEAAHAFVCALEQLKLMPADEARDRTEIDLSVGQGGTLAWLKGYAAAEVEQSYGRAYELCLSYHDVAPRALIGLMAVYIVRAELVTTARLAPLLEQQLPRFNSIDWRHAQMLLGIRGFFAGDYARAVHHLSEASGGAEDAAPEVAYQALLAWVQRASPFNLDVFFCTLTYLAWCKCMGGELDRALAMSAQTLALAERLQHPFSIALAHDFRVAMLLDLGFDPEATRKLCERQLEIANENGFPLWVATGNARMGWVHARLGHTHEAATTVNGALQLMRALGSFLVVPWGYRGLIESLLLDGRADEALAVSDEAIEFCAGRLAAGSEPVLLGLRARALAACGQATAAEAQWNESLERLRARDAKWPELCIAVEYARFLRDAGRGAEGRELLAPLYASMATKLDLPVLQSARELLATH